MKFDIDSMWGMNGKQTSVIVVLSAIGLLMCCSCTTTEIIDAVQGLTNAPPAVVTNIISDLPSVGTDTGPSATASPASCGCDLSTLAITSMPDVQAVTVDHPHAAECGLEEREGKPIRPVVTERGHILTVSDIYYGKIKTVDGGYEIPCDVQWLGYRWHPIGYSINDDHVAKMQVRFKAGEKHFVPRQFRVFLFVEGRK